MTAEFFFRLLVKPMSWMMLQRCCLETIPRPRTRILLLSMQMGERAPMILSESKILKL